MRSRPGAGRVPAKSLVLSVTGSLAVPAASVWGRGHHRATCTGWRRNRRPNLRVFHGQAEDNPAQGAKERAHDDQGLAATAGRSAYKASRFDNTSHGCRNPVPNPGR
jgi:hypothetical protein